MKKTEKESGRTAQSSQHPRPRFGKTERDRLSGAKATRLANQAARGNWSQNRPTQGRNPATFPGGTCNGKKTRRLRRHA